MKKEKADSPNFNLQGGVATPLYTSNEIFKKNLKSFSFQAPKSWKSDNERLKYAKNVTDRHKNPLAFCQKKCIK